LRHSRLERWIIGGFALILTGFIWALMITANWIASDFGALNQFRQLLAAATFTVTGFQIIFAGFLLSVMSGNRATHLRAI